MKKRIAMLMTVVFAVSMAACGSTVTTADSSNTADSEAAAEQAETGAETEDSSEMSTFEKIMSTGKLVVATEAAFEPFEYIDEDTGEIVGYDKDILDRICEDWGVELEQLDMPFQGLLTGLDAGQYDFVCTAVTMTSERASQYAFTRPVAIGGQVAVRLKDNDEVYLDSDGVLNLDGLNVGVQSGSAGETAIASYAEQYADKGTVNVTVYTSFPEIYLDLESGRQDILVQGRPAAMQQVNDNPDKYEIICDVGDLAYYGWVCRQGDEDLVEAINEEFAIMEADGTLAELQEKWFGETFDLPSEDYLPQ